MLRLLASLEHAHLVQRLPDGRYALRAAVARLHTAYASGLSLEPVVLPVRRELFAATRESATFHGRQGEPRLCLYRVVHRNQCATTYAPVTCCRCSAALAGAC